MDIGYNEEYKGIRPPYLVQIDPTLTKQGFAADAKVTGRVVQLAEEQADRAEQAAEEVEHALDGYATQEWVNDQGFLTSIPDNSVTGAKIASNAVTEVKIYDSAVSESKIRTNAVTTNKIADGAVGNSKVADGAISSVKLADNAVTEGKINNGAVTNDKLNITKLYVHGKNSGDTSSIGAAGSASFGHTNFISGSGSVIIGNNNDSVDEETGERIYGLTSNNSFLVGQKTLVTGVNAVSIGSQNKVTGSHGFTQGRYNVVSGYAASAFGEGLKATGQDQCVRGKYNSTTSGYADIVGWGSSADDLKNLSALKTNGDLKLKGDVYVGCNDDSTGGTKLIIVPAPPASGEYTLKSTDGTLSWVAL